MVCFLAAEIMFCSASLATEGEGETEGSLTDGLSDYDFGEIDKLIQDSMEQTEFHFAELVELCMGGNWSEAGIMLGNQLKESLLGEVNTCKTIAWQLLLWSICGALFLVLSRAVAESTVTDTGYMVLYMGMAALLLAGFGTAARVAATGLEQIENLLQVFLPIFFAAVAVQGQAAAAAMYEMAMVLLGGMIWLCETILLKGIRIWLSLRMAEGILPEDWISRFTQGMKKLLQAAWKTAFGIAVGLQVVQTLITPYLNQMGSSMLVRLASAIPGVGNSLGEAVKLALSTAALVRNGIGVGGILLLFYLALGPVCKLLIFSLTFQGLAMAIQPFSDKRLTDAVSSVGEGCFFLLEIMGMGVICFAILIALSCNYMNGSVY
jgi:stage III sporulation protein AE